MSIYKRMTHNENKKIRALYFCGTNLNLIANEIKKDISFVKEIISSMQYERKRKRYYRWLVNFAYSNNMSLLDISKKTKVNVLTLRKAKRENNICTKRQVHNKKINEDIEKLMIERYSSGVTCSLIAKEFGFKTSKTVENVLFKNGIPTRIPRKRRLLDYNYFKKINNHDKAYILGLLYTDGYIYRNYEGICIQLTQSDKYLLERIASKIGKSVTVIDVDCKSKRLIMPNSKNMSRLGIYSRELAEQVKSLGLIRNKTYNLEMTKKVPDKYLYSFLRGVIDGDGCIGVYKTGINCNFVSMAPKFVEQLVSLPKLKNVFKVYTSKNGLKTVRVQGGKEKTISFLKLLYKNKNDLFLERKYEKVQDYLC
jgi:hypothetical protein